jgi:hypothetical protein
MVTHHRSGTRWLPVHIDDFNEWQAGLLEESAKRLGCDLAPSGRVHRWGSVGSPVVFRGEPVWLRVSPFLEHEMNWNAWRGTIEAAAIPGVCKPSLLHRIEWHADASIPVPVSAEILTLVTDPVASDERILRTTPNLSEDWFLDLSTSLAALRAVSTDRRFPVHSAEEYSRLVSATYRKPVPASHVSSFGTEHLDMAWDNITAPRFQILDMEHWGMAITGYGAAYLYLTALAVPAVAAQVHAALADVLDAPSGRYAQLVAAALILRSLTRLPDSGGLATRLHHHTDTLLA